MYRLFPTKESGSSFRCFSFSVVFETTDSTSQRTSPPLQPTSPKGNKTTGWEGKALNPWQQKPRCLCDRDKSSNTKAQPCSLPAGGSQPTGISFPGRCKRCVLHPGTGNSLSQVGSLGREEHTGSAGPGLDLPAAAVRERWSKAPRRAIRAAEQIMEAFPLNELLPSQQLAHLSLCWLHCLKHQFHGEPKVRHGQGAWLGHHPCRAHLVSIHPV